MHRLELSHLSSPRGRHGCGAHYVHFGLQTATWPKIHPLSSMLLPPVRPLHGLLGDNGASLDDRWFPHFAKELIRQLRPAHLRASDYFRAARQRRVLDLPTHIDGYDWEVPSHRSMVHGEWLGEARAPTQQPGLVDAAPSRPSEAELNRRIFFANIARPMNGIGIMDEPRDVPLARGGYQTLVVMQNECATSAGVQIRSPRVVVIAAAQRVFWVVFVHVVGGRRPMRGVTGFSPGRKGKVHRYGPSGSRIEVTWYLNMLTDHFIDHPPFGALDHKFVVKSGPIMS